MADRKEFEIDGRPLSSLRVVDLKIELEKRGLSKSGSKKELSDRLKMQLQLEKLHESASTDEGHVPNLRLQDDEIAEHNDLIKDYLAKQQQIYEIQKEAIRRVELEKSACDSEASAGNTSQEEEDSESNKAVVEQQITVPSNTTAESIEPTVGQATCKKKDDSSFPIPDVQNLEENIEEQQQEHTSVIQCGSLNVTSDASLSIEKETIEKEMAHTEEIESQIKDVSSFVAHDEINEGKQLPADEELAGNAIETDHNKEVTESQLPSTLLDDSPVVDRKLSHERDSEAVVEPSILEVSISPDETHSALEADRETTAISTHTKDEDERLEVASTKCIINVPSDETRLQNTEHSENLVGTESSLVDEKGEAKGSESTPSSSDKKGSVDAAKTSPKHKPRLKRTGTWAAGASLAKIESEDTDLKQESQATELSSKGEESSLDHSHPTDSTTVQEENHRTSSVREAVVSKSDKNDDKRNTKIIQGVEPSSSERRSRSHRRSRDSSTSSSSTSDESSSRSRSGSGSGSNSSASGSGSRSRSRSPKKNVEYPPEDSMETNEDSMSRSSPGRLQSKTHSEDKAMEVDEPSLDGKETVAKTNATKVSGTHQGETTARISSRKISLSSSREKTEKGGEGKENQEASESEKPQRKRKWGGSGAASVTVGKKASLSISTDSLKGLIPDVKPLSTLNSGISEPVPESPVEVRDVSEADSTPEVKETGDGPHHNAASGKRDVVKEKVRSVIPERDIAQGKRLILKNSTSVTVNDEPGAARRSPSPARYPPSCIVHVRNLVRPFTLNQLKELLSRTGTLIEGGFWIDKIKSKCYVTYASESEAVATRQALHGVQWPSSNPKRLIVDFATQDELEFHRSLTEAVEVKRKVTTSGYSEAKEGPRVKSPPLPRRRIPVTQDSVVPTEAKPQPPTKDAHRVDHDRQTREQERSRRDQKRHTSSRSQSGGGGGSKSERRGLGHEREGERQRVRDRDKENVVGGGQHPQPPIREWDRDKIGEKSPGERARAARNRNRSSLSRSRSRSRGARSPLPPDGFGRRDRDRDRDRGRMGSGPRDRRDKRIDRDRRKEEEEAPAKLLDDLFRKTKATPCIYWLPLTAEQIKLKEEERRLRQAEREKRKQQVDPGERERNVGVSVEQTKRSREKLEDTRNRRRSESPSRSRARRR